MNFPSASAVVRAFRLLAVAEAFSWAALLAGMYFKWIAGTTELGVEIAGPVHGTLFIGYGVAALVLWRLQRWPLTVALFAGLSAVFPFATVLFERWALRRGYLSAGRLHADEDRVHGLVMEPALVGVEDDRRDHQAQQDGADQGGQRTGR
ncbi:integral membrane protein [Arthrobacter globiformis]|nr:integral membrane protein [Arthrobacter globiformis]